MKFPELARAIQHIVFHIVLVLIAIPALVVGADKNGYKAKYEKSIGDPPPCSAVISSISDSDWEKLNDPKYPVICVAPGDYTSKGVINITARGSSGNKRWLRYYDPQDNGANPWQQDGPDRAIISGLLLDGASHWTFHRLTVDGKGAKHNGFYFKLGSNINNIIIDHLLIQNHKASLVLLRDNGPNIFIQNSVIRSSVPSDSVENMCVELNKSNGVRVVNNEIYNCHKSVSSGSGNRSIPDTKIENNDLYTDVSRYTDCKGNYTPSINAPCSTTETLISLKAGGTKDRQVEIINNRLWGNRGGDGKLIGGVNASNGAAVSISNFAAGDYPYGKEGYPGADYLLFKNNIFMEQQAAIKNYWGTPDHVSIVGNIFYKMRPYRPDKPSYGVSFNRIEKIEVYLNTFIGAESSWLQIANNFKNSEIMCNVIIDSGKSKGTIPSTVIVDSNAFYATPMSTSNGTSRTNITKSRVSDAKQGEFCFYRKLLTKPEKVCIPNLRPESTSPHIHACDSTLGSRLDRGVNDSPF